MNFLDFFSLLLLNLLYLIEDVLERHCHRSLRQRQLHDVFLLLSYAHLYGLIYINY
jgi:hypothetical protein